jgi:lysophospholipase L1-like esterase
MRNAYWRRAAAGMLLALASGVLIPCNAEQAAKKPVSPHWYASWTASPFDSVALPPAIFAPSTEGISDQTIRQQITISHGGSYLRVRFSNEYGKAPLHIGAAAVGYKQAGHIVRTPLTFGGSATITALAGAPVVSDPVAVTLADGADLEINLYLPDKTPVQTFHLLGLQPSILSAPGNFVMADTISGATPFEIIEKMSGRRFPARLFLSEVDVAGSKPVKTVVAFGDSITDGMGSTTDTNRRWPDYLSRRISQAKLNLSVVNQGIGGNQVLARGLGDSALERFDRDALALPGASTIILMEGINDIGFSGNMVPGFSRTDIIPAEDIIQGYRQLIGRAHARGLRIIGATMTAFAGSPAFTPEKEAVRQTVNTWIRSSGAFDAVVDFDAVTKDPQKPDQLKPSYNGGDHIHLNDAGYEAMAAAIPLSKL